MMTKDISARIKKTTLPFEHFSLTEEYITKKICVKTGWDTELNEPENVFDLPEDDKALSSETPDPRLH